MPGIRFPFPQNRMSAGCIYPTGYRNEDVLAAYARWKADTVTSDGAGGHLRIKRPNDPGLDPNTTVSEGIGYGMLIAVYMGDADSQHLFDELWKYERLHLDELGLMDWYISADGSQSLGLGGAGDADEDMAFALLMADKQWGGKGSLDRNYLDYAKDQLNNIWLHEVVDSKLLSGGDHGFDWHCVNISYFAPAYYRVFEKYDHVDAGLDGWDAVIKTVYDTIANALEPGGQRRAGEREQRPGPGLVRQQRAAQRRLPDRRHQLPVRLVPHAVPHRPRRLLVRHARGQELPREDQQLLRRHRRVEDRRRLRAQRHAATDARGRRRSVGGVRRSRGRRRDERAPPISRSSTRPTRRSPAASCWSAAPTTTNRGRCCRC